MWGWRMIEEHKKKLCELAGVVVQKIAGGDCIFDSSGCYYPLLKNVTLSLEILIKAMWAINRERKYLIQIDAHCVYVKGNNKALKNFTFRFSDYNNNSEQEALTAALEYIHDGLKKGE